MSEEEIKIAKRKRTTALARFTRVYNILCENVDNGDTPASEIDNIYDDLVNAYKEIESTNDNYLLYFDTEDEEYVKSNSSLEDAYRRRCDISIKISKIFHVESSSDVKNEKPKIGFTKSGPINIKKLDAPKFSGNIRNYPTFVKTYAKYMEPIYGHDAYALRNCLEGEALEIVSGVDDNCDEMWKRLDVKYRDSEKLVDSVLRDLKQLRPLNENDDRGLINLVNVVERCWMDLERLDMGKEMNTATMISLIEKLLPPIQKREWTINKQKHYDNTNKFQILLKFLVQEKNALEYMVEEIRDPIKEKSACVNFVSSQNLSGVPNDVGTNSSVDKLQQAVEELTRTIASSGLNGPSGYKRINSNTQNCCLHNTNTHYLSDCKTFKGLPISERKDIVSQNKACFRCLKTGHFSRSCPDRKNCDIMGDSNQICNRAHHPLLHENQANGSSLHHKRSKLEGNGTLLMLTKVNSMGRTINAIIDPCSNLSLITHKAAKRLNLNGNEITVTITKVGNITEVMKTKEYILCIKDCFDKMWCIQAYGIDEITSDANEVDLSETVKLFKNIKISDIERPIGHIELLIGLDCCELFPNKISSIGNLQLMHGPLGYCLRGSHASLKCKSPNSDSVLLCVHNTIIDLDDMDFYPHSNSSEVSIKNYFDFENIGTSLLSSNCSNCKELKGITNENISIKESREMQMIKDGLNYDEINKYWTVSYPWIRDISTLRNNFIAAFGRLKSLERRLLKNNMKDLYCDQINDMVSRGVAKKLSKYEMDSYKGPIYYIPHHSVYKPTSVSTPLRIVFNSSCTFMGERINDFWAKGPDMLNTLFGVLIRFREDIMAIHGDISKMYNSVRLATLEQHTHRFLWRDGNIDRNVDHYSLLAVPFGDRPSGSIVITAMCETAKMKQNQYPYASSVIIKNSYVDDILKSVSNISEAKKLMHEVELILMSGGFRIKHWILSGHSGSLENEDHDIKIADVTEGSVLGMVWKPKEDVFKFKGKHINEISQVTNSLRSRKFTRRMALSETSKLYDPLGLLSPFTLRAKLIMREICLIKSNKSDDNWDNVIPSKINSKLIDFLLELPLVNDISFNRSVKPVGAVGNPMLIIYSDGSNVSYGACAYVRWTLNDGSFVSNLLCAKSRLTPLKTITVPRIELMGAVMACRMQANIVRESDYKFETTYHIIDSQIVLEQIHKDSYKFGVFVANRISEIQNTTVLSDWWWCKSSDNAADMVTRPMWINRLNDDDWKHGPAYLIQDIAKWPISQTRSNIGLIPDIISHNTNVSILYKSDINLVDINIERYSDLQQLLNVTAIVLKIVKSRTFKCKVYDITANDINDAQIYWIKYVQLEFAADWKKRFMRLGPFMRSDNVITVGHRISSWIKDNFDSDYLILLPPNSPLSRLVVKSIHEMNHDGIDTTISKVRKQYWIPHISRLAKHVRNDCYKCRLLDKKLCTQLMGKLPIERLKPSPAFYYCGIDLFGPLLIKDNVKKRTQMKCYGVIITCFTTRAVFIDITCGYDTENFLMVLRRFISIHGCPYEILSDNGTQLVAAGKELKEFIESINYNAVMKFCKNFGLNWVLTKSADAPWENGVTERLIKSVKRCLKLTVGDNILTFSELQTVCFECANVMNGRPIGMKNADHAYFCPNDLLLGRSTIKAPACDYDLSINAKKRFQFIENLIQSYWKRWQIHYFPSLIIQQKWNVSCRNLCVGDIVLVPDSKSLRGHWKLAEVHSANAGKDGKVRDVVLRYKKQDDKTEYTGSKDILINRSVHRLVLIVPIEERIT